MKICLEANEYMHLNEELLIFLLLFLLRVKERKGWIYDTEYISTLSLYPTPQLPAFFGNGHLAMQHLTIQPVIYIIVLLYKSLTYIFKLVLKYPEGTVIENKTMGNKEQWGILRSQLDIQRNSILTYVGKIFFFQIKFSLSG